MCNRSELALLRHCAMFFPNELEGSWISSAMEPHDILLRLRDKGLRGVVPPSCEDAANSRPIHSRSKPWISAGDCFNAGFIFA